ncbi:MAG: SDR family oxidoreductase [Candidatus Magasanikbacteria bacterium]
MVNILVTGHLGYIGTILVQLLKEKGYRVTGLDTGYFKDCVFYSTNATKPDVEIVKDIRLVSMEDLKNIDAICHLSAISNDPMGELNPQLTEEINFRSSINLARCAQQAGVKRFLFSSSCSMYGKSGSNAVDEESTLSPITAYAKSKVLTELELRSMAREDFCPIYLRNSTAYGVSPHMRMDLVVNNLMAWAVTTGNVHIMSDGSPWRPILHVEDIARSFLLLLEAPQEKVHNQAFNIGANSENYQIKEIAHAVANLVPNSQVAFSEAPDKDSRSYRVSFDKIKTIFPEFKLKWNLDSGAKQLYYFYTTLGIPQNVLQEREFIRLKQLQYLKENKLIDNELYWTKTTVALSSRPII